MANPEHMALVGKGSEAIAEWRRANPGVRLDLFQADLGRADLKAADLSRADLAWVKLPLADLRRADLRWTSLRWAYLLGADLPEAKLGGADLLLANLMVVTLRCADLSGTNLTAANLGGADLRQAKLTRGDMGGANLSGANLSGADLSHARLRVTSLSNVDLSQVIGLETVKHESPSSVGADTLILSFRGAGNRLTPELETFFRGAGVPEGLLEALPDIVRDIKYYTCFIAYGQPDVEFANRLVGDLRGKGVSCWVYDMDATPGERTWGEIGRRRREADKMVLVCSAKALVRDGVLKEIEEQIDEDPDKLVPVSLDDLWKEPGFKVIRGSRDLKPFLMERNWADFAGWESDPSRYDRALERLLAGLKREDR